MQGWQIERVRDKVDRMGGELNIRIYLSDDATFKIWYNPRDDVALYGRVVYDNNGREGLAKAWLRELLHAVNSKGARIFVQYRNDEKKSAWFGPENDMKPINAAYQYVMSLDSHGRHKREQISAVADSEED